MDKNNNTKDSNLLARLKLYLANFTPINYPWSKIFYCCLRRKKWFIRETIIQKAIEKVEGDLDPMKILTKVKKVEKINDFLFDLHERTLFEYFTKQNLILRDPRAKLHKKNPHEFCHTTRLKTKI